jgi:hypothetical protein
VSPYRAGNLLLCIPTSAQLKQRYLIQGKELLISKPTVVEADCSDSIHSYGFGDVSNTLAVEPDMAESQRPQQV